MRHSWPRPRTHWSSDWSTAFLDEPAGALDVTHKRLLSAHLQAMLASRHGFSQAFVVARGGPVEPVKASGATPPILLTLSEDDPSHDEMSKLDEGLTREGWPHERFVSQGGHALPDPDIDAALAFFQKGERTQ